MTRVNAPDAVEDFLSCPSGPAYDVQVAHDQRVKQLSRMPRSVLAAMVDAHPTFVWADCSPARWSHDELVSWLLDAEFPAYRSTL